jgi:peptidoglycan/LPS O-acetylase OafA/YrhL
MKDDWACVVNIFHRALRILPSFLFIIMLYLAFYMHLVTSGQLWPGEISATKNCEKIWRVFLFVNNFFGELCFGNGWYLYVDMQLYAFSMLILLLYKYNSTASKILIWILIMIGIVQLLIFCQITGYAIPIRLQDI